jgi:hypothetical protein
MESKSFNMKVVYLNKENERFRYYYKKRQGEGQGQFSIDRSTKLFTSGFFF